MYMAEPVAEDHDQRLKVLLKEFIEQFFVCFFPDWAVRFDFHNLNWLDNSLLRIGFFGMPNPISQVASSSCWRMKSKPA